MSKGKWTKPTGIEQTTRWRERKTKRPTPKDTMLRDFLLAKTPYEKRMVIQTFNPHYFLLTTPTQGDSNEPRLQTSL